MKLHLTLLSDATFGRGDGVAGLVDAEVEHDPATGLPFLRGRTLKGLLVEACDSVLFPLRLTEHPAVERLEEAGRFLFGVPGSAAGTAAGLHVGPARVPAALRAAVEADVRAGRLRPDSVLDSLTAVRRQTAVDAASGAPEEGALRAARVLLRRTPLEAELDSEAAPTNDARALLAAAAAGLHRAGTARNRGRGRLRARLRDGDADITGEGLAHLRTLLLSSAP